LLPVPAATEEDCSGDDQQQRARKTRKHAHWLPDRRPCVSAAEGGENGGDRQKQEVAEEPRKTVRKTLDRAEAVALDLHASA
jgi:hypothetical protein